MYGNFGFIEIYVIINEVIYSWWIVYVVYNCSNGLGLVGCFFKGEVVWEGLVVILIYFVGKIWFGCVVGIYI